MNLPIADKIPHTIEIHGQIINDEYAWLRDPLWPTVKDERIIKYLTEENNYSKQFFSPLAAEKDKIFEELKSRIKLDDQSPYIKKDNYYYYTKEQADKDYPIYCRKFGSTVAPEAILLDVNILAHGQKFTQLGSFSISPDHKLISYSIDFAGDEKYKIRVYDLESQKYLNDEIPNTIGNIVWHEKLNGFFYTPTNENWRHDKVMFHLLGTDAQTDRLVFHEADYLYQVDVHKSGSRDYIFINVNGHDNNEVYFINMEDSEFQPQLITNKQTGIFYEAEHNGDYFYIKTNENARNFKISRIKIDDFQNNSQVDYIKEEADQYLSSFDLTKNYLILNYRKVGLPLIKIRYLHSGQEKFLKFPDQSFIANAGSTNFEEDDLRVTYSSLARPSTIYSYDFFHEELSAIKIQEIPGGFNQEEYMVERIFAEHDGVKVPITLFYKKSLFKKDGSNPLYLYGYGSYGISIPVSFRNSAISLANRGFVYAVAHIRGGDDLGHDWYEAAKFLTKKRTFMDFIQVAEKLIADKYTSKGNIVICGGSAGGLLIGAVLNEKPELFKAAISHVPFVDILNTMLDDTLPLTPGEFKEWGNPQEKEYFEYIRSYSPYDNIKAQHYPSLFITAGLSDPRVGYWEAAKWVAKLRTTKTDKNTLLLKTNMEAGHKGASGRFDYLKEAADDLVFISKIFNQLP